MGNLGERSGKSPWEPPAQGSLHPEQDGLAASTPRLALEEEKEERVPPTGKQKRSIGAVAGGGGGVGGAAASLDRGTLSGGLFGTHFWGLTEQLEVTALSTSFKQGFLANIIRLQIKKKKSSNLPKRLGGERPYNHSWQIICLCLPRKSKGVNCTMIRVTERAWKSGQTEDNTEKNPQLPPYP